MNEILKTERLILRELTLDDLDEVAEMLGNPEVMHHWPQSYDREESAVWIERQLERYARDGYGYWLALDRESSQVVGQAGVLQTEAGGTQFPALGYIINSPFWRRGFATEAARACITYTFDRLNRSTAYALIRPENGPSLGVAAKLGMKVERTVVFAELDHYLVSLKREEMSW